MSTSSAGDFPVSQSVVPGKGEAKKMKGGSGRSSIESFAAFSPNGCLSKMYRGCYLLTLEGSLLEYCETFPKAGMMQNGILYRLPVLAHRTSEKGSLSWPTPQANKTTPNTSNLDDLVNSSGEPWKVGEKPYDRRTGKQVTTCLGDAVRMWPTPVSQDDNKSPEAHMAMKRRMKGGPRKKITSLNVMVKAVERGIWPTPSASDGMGGPGCSGRDGGANLRTAVQSFPTPAARDYRSPNKNGNMADQLPNVVGGSLNADWVELLMGFPRGWTDLGAKDGKMGFPESSQAKKTEWTGSKHSETP